MRRLTPPLNLPAPGRCQSLYVVLTTSQRHVFLLNSHRALFTASLVRSGCAPSRPRPPLIPKLRGEIAEFLNEGSIERLSLFSPPTCVGLRYELPADWGGGVFLAASPLSVRLGLPRDSPSVLTRNYSSRTTALARDVQHPGRHSVLRHPLPP